MDGVRYRIFLADSGRDAAWLDKEWRGKQPPLWPFARVALDLGKE